MPGLTKLAVLYLSCVFPFVLSAQNAQPENKIDLPFSILIAQQKSADSVSRKKGAHLKACFGKMRLVDTSAKKYECIIYTSNPSVLRKVGIIVQSELTGFVTALATLQQIELAAAMKEVRFIKAPEHLDLHKN
ncbi:hypothetical protein FAM09_16975 [Niastella caeni]|uniref:Uncharacterized protein n=1 Tax=Niastella caeni TaxID=2569763 RepID=A0A4S8HS59_9BACT|nr:hypothetical protein [Niastella caeni]THU38367.1 hypothetical protein FAM09_16975 [Niastella caeni]